MGRIKGADNPFQKGSKQEPERDYLEEAFNIIFDKTRMLAQKEHLVALNKYYADLIMFGKIERESKKFDRDKLYFCFH